MIYLKDKVEKSVERKFSKIIVINYNLNLDIQKIIIKMKRNFGFKEFIEYKIYKEF